MGQEEAVFVPNLSDSRRSHRSQTQGGSFHSGVQRNHSPSLERDLKFPRRPASSSSHREFPAVRPVIEPELYVAEEDVN